jgi:hypothetical protein
MNQYWVLVKSSETPGSYVTRVYLQAADPFSAISMARSMYGRLLLSEYASVG